MCVLEIGLLQRHQISNEFMLKFKQSKPTGTSFLQAFETRINLFLLPFVDVNDTDTDAGFGCKTIPHFLLAISQTFWSTTKNEVGQIEYDTRIISWFNRKCKQFFIPVETSRAKLLRRKYCTTSNNVISRVRWTYKIGRYIFPSNDLFTRWRYPIGIHCSCCAASTLALSL